MRSFIALAVGTALAYTTGAAAHKHEDKNQNHTVPEIRDTWFAPATATSASIADGLGYTALNPPIKFVHQHQEGVKMNKTHVKIRIHDHKVYQQIRGFGGSLSEHQRMYLLKGNEWLTISDSRLLCEHARKVEEGGREGV
jgi:hypothetical protein